MRWKSWRRMGISGVAAISVAGLLLAQGAAGGVKQVGSVALAVQFDGGGPGTITQISGPGTGTPQGINCTNPSPGLGNTCSASLPFGAPPQPFVGLQANAAANSEFIGWQVLPVTTPMFHCNSETECYVQMNGDVTVVAQFQALAARVPVEVTRNGSGASLGVVTSVPSGLFCGLSYPDCATSFPNGAAVTLNATTTSGATFGGWGGACASSGSAPTCSLTPTKATKVSATFNAPTQGLTVTVQGSGGVSSGPAGIACPATCQASFAQGSQVTLYAMPAANFSFTGWSGGGCSGQGTCTLTLNAATGVTATFAQITQSLLVDTDGTGTVTSTPAGITCPTTCQAPFAQASQVTLAAAPGAGYQFAGWSGAGCTGTGSCIVTMSQAQLVEASFTPAPVQASFATVRVTTNGPRLARRTVTVVVANQEIAGVNIRILRAGSQLLNVTFRRQAIGTHRYPLGIPNRVAVGRANLQVTFTNAIGTRKVQTQPFILPSVPAA
jgi:hypothetical protein